MTIGGGLGVAGKIYAGSAITATQLQTMGGSNNSYQSTNASYSSPTLGGTSGGTNAIYNTSAIDGRAAYDLYMSRNTAGNQQQSYTGSVSTPTGYTPIFVIGQQTGPNSYAERLRIDTSGWVGIGTTAPGQLLDVNGGISATSLYINGTQFNPSANSSFSGTLAVGGGTGGADLDFGGDSARTVAMDRVTTTNTAGNNFTVNAGGATSIATDKNGGSLVLAGGTATGMGTSSIQFQTATAQGSTSTTDNLPTTKMTIMGNGDVGIGTTAPTARLEVNGNTLVDGTLTTSGGNLGIGGTYPMSISNATTTTINPARSYLSLNGDVSVVKTLAIRAGAYASDTDASILLVSGNSRLGKAPDTLTWVSGVHSASVTTIVVGSTAGYPTRGTLLINGEAINYDGTTGTTFTNCTRGSIGTVAVTFSGGETVDNYLVTAVATSTTPKTVITGGGKVGIGTAAPAASLDVSGTIKLGASGTAFSSMGVCAVASYAATNVASDQTCTGIPASTAVAVNCSASAAFDTPNTTVIYARASGVADTVSINLSAANTTAVGLTCMWIKL